MSDSPRRHLFLPSGHMISFLNKGLAMLCSGKDIKTFIDKYVQFADSNKRFKNELQKCANRSKEMGNEVTENLVLDEENDDIDLTELPENVPQCKGKYQLNQKKEGNKLLQNV